MTLKPTAKLAGLQPPAVVGLVVACEVFRGYGIDPVVTSAVDSVHGEGSLHHKGLAFDLRMPTRCVGADAAVRSNPGLDLNTAVARSLREACGPEFDVVLETHQADPMQHHIHVEYDPS